jgi:bifunctional non-homologous end joining protein LigD
MVTRLAGGKDVRIFTRRGNDWTARFPLVKKELQQSKLPPGWYDGEIVVLDASGLPSFNALQNAIESARNDSIVYFLFDAPYMDGFDLRRVPVEDRRACLASVLVETDRLRFSKELDGPPQDLLATACKMGLEGVIGKRRGHPTCTVVRTIGSSSNASSAKSL